ncbi:YncE family protein [Flavobacterium sp. WC2509]|uniref:YncE family protein n=1 Tax=Flavobacterium sp. WC2509 TaxID=3461406 RepID=UPI004044D068
MKFSKSFFVALVSVPLFVSCNNDDDKVDSGDYNEGILVLNEGGSGQGSVSYISNDLSTFTQDAYTLVNGSDLLGKYVQSIFFDGDNAYIISGGSNKITVVNRNTFKIVAKIETGLVNPRYGVVKDGKAYVTNANTYSYANPATGDTDDYVAVINLTTNLVESKIELKATANRIVLENGKLYITEPFTSDKVLVVNPTTKALETPINVGSDADTMEVKNGVLYVLRSPYGIASEIVKVKLSDSSLSKITFPADLQDAQNLDIEQSKIYYTVGTSVYGIDLAATVASKTAILTYTSTSKYGQMYGFAVKNNHIFIADGGDFTANSKSYVYSLTGTLQKEFTVGVGPNGFYFND